MRSFAKLVKYKFAPDEHSDIDSPAMDWSWLRVETHDEVHLNQHIGSDFKNIWLFGLHVHTKAITFAWYSEIGNR